MQIWRSEKNAIPRNDVEENERDAKGTADPRMSRLMPSQMPINLPPAARRDASRTFRLPRSKQTRGESRGGGCEGIEEISPMDFVRITSAAGALCSFEYSEYNVRVFVCL